MKGMKLMGYNLTIEPLPQKPCAFCLRAATYEIFNTIIASKPKVYACHGCLQILRKTIEAMGEQDVTTSQ